MAEEQVPFERCQSEPAVARNNSNSAITDEYSETGRKRSVSNPQPEGQDNDTPTVERRRTINGHSDGSINSDKISLSSVTLKELAESTEQVLRRRSASILEVREQAHMRLREELLKAQEELKLKDEQCRKLEQVQIQMGKELEDLTASLFEEANNMVQDANIKRMQAEKLLKESNAKIEVLSAEVTALKTLVITSTPSMPNRHLHPQLEKGKKKAEGNGSDGGFIKGHRRSTSHHNFTKDISMVDMDVAPPTPPKDDREVDPVYFGEFSAWKERPNMVPDTPFLSRIINEDIKPCLNFTNKELSQRLHQSIVHNSLSVEPMPEKNPFPRKCALTEKTRICKYRIRLGDSEPWHYVSQAARNRITTVCDFYTYTRYITQGIVKSDERDQYWEIMRLRKQMNLSRLGIS